MPLGMVTGHGPGYIVLHGDPAPPPPQKRGTASNFQPMSVVAKTAGWIKMPPGREVGLGPGDIVLDGDPAPPPRKGAQQPSPTVTIYGCRHCVRPCNLWPMSIVAKRLDGSRCHLVRR